MEICTHTEHTEHKLGNTFYSGFGVCFCGWQQRSAITDIQIVICTGAVSQDIHFVCTYINVRRTKLNECKPEHLCIHYVCLAFGILWKNVQLHCGMRPQQSPGLSDFARIDSNYAFI